MNLYNPYNNINLWIKHTFLSFAQGYFSLDEKFTWDINPILTKLIIADKFAVDLGVIEKRPAIILSRGSFGWTDTIRGQDGINAPLSSKRVDTLAPAPSDVRCGDFIFTDLLRVSVTYNILSKSGIEAEEIANKLFVALSGYKREMQSYGIHHTMGLTIGDERIVKTTSEIEAMGVTVSLGFMAQRSIEKAIKLNNIEVIQQVPRTTTVGTITQDIYLKENIDYHVINNGMEVEFVNPPAAFPETTALQVNFVDAITISGVSSTLVGIIDGENRTYTVNGGTVLGYYTLTAEIIVSGMANIQLESLEEYIMDVPPEEYDYPWPSGYTWSGLTETDELATEEIFKLLVNNDPCVYRMYNSVYWRKCTYEEPPEIIYSKWVISQWVVVPDPADDEKF